MNHYHQRSLENSKSLELIQVVIYYYFFCVQKPYCDIPTKKQALLITVIKGKICYISCEYKKYSAILNQEVFIKSVSMYFLRLIMKCLKTIQDFLYDTFAKCAELHLYKFPNSTLYYHYSQ